MIDNDGTEEALTRLRASDPATGSHPDLHSLRRAIAAKAPASVGGDADAVTAYDDDLLRGPRVRTPWIAAAAVAALGIGAGGYALGAQGGDPGPVTAGQQTSQVRPGAATEEGPAPAPETMGTDTEMGGGKAAGGGVAGASAGGGGAGQTTWDPGPVRLSPGPGLPTDHGTGTVRAIVAPVEDEAFLTAWGERLDLDARRPVEGTTGLFGANALVDVNTYRVLSTQDASGGPLSFSYEDILGAPQCTTMFEGMDETARNQIATEWQDSFGADVKMPDPSMCKAVDGERPTPEAAVATAREWLQSTGLDFSDFNLQAARYQDETTPTVSVEGTPTDTRSSQMQVYLNIGPDGVISANGTYGDLEELGDYPLISAVEAVERHSQRAFGADYGVQLPQEGTPDEAYADDTMMSPEFALPEPVEITPGMKIPLLLKDKVVTKAELVQGYLWTQSGGSLEVPTWKLSTEDGMNYAVLAVADESIDWISWE